MSPAFRYNIETLAPGVPVDCHALAAESSGESETDAVVQALLTPTLLVTGTNVLSVELHQATPWQFTNAVFDGALTLTVFSGPVVTFAPVSQVWDWVYGDGLSSNAPTWYTPGFVESAEWQSGPGPLGVRSDKVVTSFDNNQYIATAYLRTTVQVTFPPLTPDALNCGGCR